MIPAAAPAFCRDCGADAGARDRCRSCGSPRLARHPELDALTVAHVDCDAFFAAIEKRDDPSLADRPVIIGGARRGVVSTACYVARIQGVRSAMPMFKALKLCPDAVVIRPDMEKYAAVGREVRQLMLELTPLVEPVSIDEAFLDLSGTQRLHHMAPARTLARFARRVEAEVGITVSVGLSYCKFLAKIASDRDKPRGFSVIGRAEAQLFLAGEPVGIIPGIGRATAERLEKQGIRTLGEVRAAAPEALMRAVGSGAMRLRRMAAGEDDRKVTPERERKSVSAETTFNDDIADRAELEAILWRLSERVARRLRAAEIAGTTVTLKLKTPDFRIVTRAHRLSSPTRIARRLFDTARDLLGHELKSGPFRLIGVGVADLAPIADADPPDLVDRRPERDLKLETAVDRLRERFGDAAPSRGVGLGQGQARDSSSSRSVSRPSRTKVP